MKVNPFYIISFFFNDTATTEIYTLSLHDALPIYRAHVPRDRPAVDPVAGQPVRPGDRKSTRLNSSHSSISYAVFCLKKKKKRHRAQLTAESRPGRCTPYVTQ